MCWRLVATNSVDGLADALMGSHSRLFAALCQVMDNVKKKFKERISKKITRVLILAT